MKTSICILFFIFNLSLIGQRYAFINFNTEHGLSHSQTTSIVSDQEGFLWIGTLGGLNKFNGSQVKIFGSEEGLLDDQVHSLFCEKNNTLWIGMSGGLAMKADEQFFNYKLPDEEAEHKVIAIYAKERTVLVGTDGGGLYELIDKELKRIYLPEETSQYVRAVNMYNDKIIVGTKSGIYEVDTDKKAEVFDANFDNISIADILIDRENSIWVATYNKGVFHKKEEEIKNYSIEDGLLSSSVRNLFQDQAGKIWMSTKYGVSCYDKGMFTDFDEENGLGYAQAKQCTQDYEGNIWIATNGQGLFRFCGPELEVYDEDFGLCSNRILNIFENKGTKYFSSFDQGICLETDEGSSTISVDEGLINNEVWCSSISDSGLYFGTSGGISFLNEKGKLVNYTSDNGLINNRVTSLYSSNESLLIGHTLGLSVFKKGEFKHYGEEQGSGVRIRAIIKDKKGDFWLGAEDGLYHWDGKKFSRYTEKNGLPDNTVFCLKEDLWGNIWIGTKKGLIKYDGNYFIPLKLSNDFGSSYINFLESDPSGSILVGTNNGCFQVILLHNKIERIVHFGLNDGLPSLECNLNTTYLDDEGNFWFGTEKGVVKIKSDKLINPVQDIPPRIIISGMRIFMEPLELDQMKAVNESGVIELPYNQNHVTFDYNGLSFNYPNRLEYRYKLIGADKDWLPASKVPFVTYAYLPHGKYDFQVQARQENGKWGKAFVGLPFIINPPFYLSKWFILIEIVGGLMLIYFIYRWRILVNKRKRTTETLEQQSKLLALEHQSLNSSMNRHFIFNALNSIQYYINREDKRAANKYLSSFAKLIRKNLDSSQMNFISLKSELERIELYLNLEHMRFEDRFEYEIRVDKKINTSEFQMPAMLLQPFLENSIWHGILPKNEMGKLLIDISLENNHLKILIEDNGIGIDASQELKKSTEAAHLSRGMKITNDRINLYRKMTDENFKIRGPFPIKNGSKLSIGTRVEIEIPKGSKSAFNPLEN